VDEQVANWPGKAGLRPRATGLGSLRSHANELKKASDVELMSRLRQGEQEALSHLFDRFHRLVLSVSSRIVRDRGEAEDLTQETFFDLYRLIERFDPTKGSVKAWIVQLAYHKSLNRRRYLALRGAFSERRVMEFDPLEEPSIAGPGATADDLMAIVKKGFDTLSEKQQQAVESVCFEGLLFTEIAERTKDSLGNVRHNYYRGIDKLRKYVKDNLGDTNHQLAARRVDEGGGEK
jgi:RNA polymerase sigma-70 factor, ECF subfamily